MAKHYKVAPHVGAMIDRLNLTQRQIAMKYGVSSGHLSMVLRGQRCIGPELRATLQVALNSNFDELFEEVNA